MIELRDPLDSLLQRAMAMAMSPNADHKSVAAYSLA